MEKMHRPMGNFGRASLVLTHQTDEAIPGMHNPGGFTDGDRAACFPFLAGRPS